MTTVEPSQQQIYVRANRSFPIRRSFDPADIKPEDEYGALIFLTAVVPLLKTVVAAKPALAKGFKGLDAVVQVSYRLPEKTATHLAIDGDTGQVSPVLGVHRAPNLELEFASADKLVAFFKDTKGVPKIRGGFANSSLLVATVKALLAMSTLLTSPKPPKDAESRELLVKLMFNLLTTGISQLNKAGHPMATAWSKGQPDRVYAFSVDGHDDLAAYIRVKNGRTKAARGQYTRSKPFFTMAFDSPESALGILLEIDDMIESAASGKMIMRGAPEYGADLGDLMKLVGGFAK